MRLPIRLPDNTANVAIALVKQGHPWLGYTLALGSRLLATGAIIGVAYVAALFPT